jgi:hypothetical protein
MGTSFYSLCVIFFWIFWSAGHLKNLIDSINFTKNLVVLYNWKTYIYLFFLQNSSASAEPIYQLEGKWHYITYN